MNKRSMVLGFALASLSAQAFIASRYASEFIATGLFTSKEKESWRRRGKRRGSRVR
jgi:hypothetical protein